MKIAFNEMFFFPIRNLHVIVFIVTIWYLQMMKSDKIGMIFIINGDRNDFHH